MWRQAGKQLSLADAMVARRKGQNERLERIGALLNWGRIEQLLAPIYAAGEGRPAYRPLVMLRALLLQQWYSLSDPELEEALSDRLSFRRFVGLSLEEEVPDHSTLSRYRSQLAQRGLSAQVFAEVNRQLERRGLMVKPARLSTRRWWRPASSRRATPRARRAKVVSLTPTRTGPGARAAARTSATRRTWR